MHSVVSLLDDEHYALVEEIWDRLERELGVRGVYSTPFPHFSYNVAEGYDTDAVEKVIQDFAARTAPFNVGTTGLGIFNATHPVLYIPVVRSPGLSELHRGLWEGTKRVASGTMEYYHPDRWMPHITLAHGDIDIDKVSQIVRALSDQTFHWEMSVNNLSMIYDTGAEQGLRCRFNFDGGGGRVRPDSLRRLEKQYE